jgi:putative YhdH/YhfP family quinone oxidoreductase
MTDGAYRALVTRQVGESYCSQVESCHVDDLPAGEVLLGVQYSSLNYKDVLSAFGNRGVTRDYPHTPGIDAAGVVVHSDDARFRIGQAVIVSGYDLGMNTPGGFAEYIRVPADWVVALPASLSARRAMIYGTAGFTAALCLDKILSAAVPTGADVLVTGASGGVGCLAVGLLAKVGYRVSAATGKPQAEALLQSLGAAAVMSRQQLLPEQRRPLEKGRWHAVVDTVGGDILATAIRSTCQGGVVTCCGNVASADLHVSIYPFILRGVSLLGVSAQNASMPDRKRIWQRLAGEWRLDDEECVVREVPLDALPGLFDKMRCGELLGRTVVHIG